MWDRAAIGAAVAWNRRRTAVLGILLGLGILLDGCGKGGARRLPVHGAVSLSNGENLSGSITFVPVAGSPGPAATAALSDGRYQFNRSDGPAAGPHRVTVMRAVSKRTFLESRQSKAPPASKAAAPGAEPKTQWTLSADVADDGTYQCDFTLEP
jgi:hypothetical protein